MAINTTIASNLLALNVNRNVALVSRKRDKSSNRLSSGSRLTKASEAAADLTISQKMKAQIRGLSMAEKNLEDAKSLLQVADCAYNEVQDMAQRCREIFVQTKNDTNTDEDRKKLIKEVSEILKEIDRTIEVAQFNEQNILDFNNSLIQIGNSTGESIIIDGLNKVDLIIYDNLSEESISKIIKEDILPAIEEIRNAQFGADSGGVGSTIQMNNHDTNLSIIDFRNYIDKVNGFINEIDTNLFPLLKGAIENLKKTFEESVKKAVNNTLIDWEKRGRGGSGIVSSNGDEAIWPDGMLLTYDDILKTLKNPGDKIIIRWRDAQTLSDELKAAVNEFESIFKSLGSEQFKFSMEQHIDYYLKGDEEFSPEIADLYIARFDKIISEVSDTRTTIGVDLNKLEYVGENIKVSAENLYSANSKLEDTDMAEEMMQITSANILIQAATTLMSQANSSKEDVIELLK